MRRKLLGGIKYYSKKYFGRLVNTTDFQKAFEKSTGRDLKAFFKKWIYETEG
ncbi:M1 family metallopeptidase [Ulvibacterium marinum]|uniref:M1 family metallopeptidase n=1 Tax=Ulvibacterium marinum TaxID=2419782 RepID=UPI0011C4555A|nr:M1 family metallopeptidase [Ulvibacterium marinum]